MDEGAWGYSCKALQPGPSFCRELMVYPMSYDMPCASEGEVIMESKTVWPSDYNRRASQGLDDIFEVSLLQIRGGIVYRALRRGEQVDEGLMPKLPAAPVDHPVQQMSVKTHVEKGSKLRLSKYISCSRNLAAALFYAVRGGTHIVAIDLGKVLDAAYIHDLTNAEVANFHLGREGAGFDYATVSEEVVLEGRVPRQSILGMKSVPSIFASAQLGRAEMRRLQGAARLGIGQFKLTCEEFGLESSCFFGGSVSENDASNDNLNWQALGVHSSPPLVSPPPESDSEDAHHTEYDSSEDDCWNVVPVGAHQTEYDSSEDYRPVRCRCGRTIDGNNETGWFHRSGFWLMDGPGRYAECLGWMWWDEYEGII